MTHEEAKALGATHYMVFDGMTYFFKRKGSHMHQIVGESFNGKPFSCTAFYNFKPL